MSVVDRGVQKCCSLPGNQHSKPGNYVEVESEHCQPVVKPVVCDMAESEQLVNRGDQRRTCDVVVQVAGNIKEGGTAEKFCGLLRYSVES